MFVNLKREKVAEERERERERKQHSINNNKHPQQQQGIFFYSSWREFFVGFVWLVFYDFITPEIARLLYVSICLSSLSDCLRQARKIPTQLPLFLPLPFLSLLLLMELPRQLQLYVSELDVVSVLFYAYAFFSLTCRQSVRECESLTNR